MPPKSVLRTLYSVLFSASASHFSTFAPASGLRPICTFALPLVSVPPPHVLRTLHSSLHLTFPPLHRSSAPICTFALPLLRPPYSTQHSVLFSASASYLSTFPPLHLCTVLAPASLPYSVLRTLNSVLFSASTFARSLPPQCDGWMTASTHSTLSRRNRRGILTLGRLLTLKSMAG
jgi:hypothetical protein